MDELIAAIRERINPGGQREITLRKHGVEQIEIIIPEVEEAEVQRIKRLITTTGNLQFRMLATKRKYSDLIDRALDNPQLPQLMDANGQLRAWWVPVKSGMEDSFLKDAQIAVRKVQRKGEDVLEVLVVSENKNVTGAYLVDARQGADQTGNPCVNFEFDEAGGRLFGELTGDNQPDTQTGYQYRLGIILDDYMYSAPGLKSRIYKRGEITGGFSKQEAEELAAVLRAGSLPAALAKDPISELFSGPTLGRDTIEKSTFAMLISSILVPLFMIAYYRFSGIVAVFALFLNLLVLFAVMLSVKAVFTLTGFAGVALTVGMAVDNNVLVFERLREELERGAALRMAIRNAFNRASTTIIDANLTTMITATVLYVIGTDQVKGFAVPLWIGVLVSMYTSIFVARIIFDIAEKRRWINESNISWFLGTRMLGRTKIDFMRAFPFTATASVLFIILSVAVSINRDKGLLDIDFTGGVSVQTLFNNTQDIEQVRKKLSDRLPDLAVSGVSLMEEEKQGVRFIVNTSEMETDTVKRVLTETFGGELTHNSLEFSPPSAVASSPPGEPVGKPGEPVESAEPAKPAEPAAEGTAPPGGEQSRRDLPPRTMLAFAGEDSLAVMLADNEPAAEPDGVAGEKSPDPGEQAPKAAEGEPLPETDIPAHVVEEQPAGPDPFAGGVQSELKFSMPVNHEAVVQLFKTALDEANIDSETTAFSISNPEYDGLGSATHSSWTLKTMLPTEKVASLLESMKRDLDDNPLFPTSNMIGTSVAGHTQVLALYALTASWLCIIIYLWIRFQGVAFGLAAVAALVHDVFIMLGAVAVSIYLAPFLGFLLIDQFKINLPIVVAFLTIIGFSVNDTIVIFDRIREVRGKSPEMTKDMVNLSVNQTLSRTLLTSLTVLIVVVVLYISGGDA
ncbi:MAG: protein translocase subunit SecD, partial [Pirellulaceae bacterium]|nr:protein translocase subunit SecD [Pirellulaceae bacterium]